VADGEALPFNDGSFDLVHAKDSLHHMEHPERALEEFRRVLGSGGSALLVEANRHHPTLYLQMTLVRRHDHFSRQRFQDIVTSAFPDTRLGSFDAHYVPGAGRLLGLQHVVEDGVERIPFVRRLASYNFAVATR
jgi:ubiquinone/menaquinone biosynthesis C-methylase UbiE